MTEAEINRIVTDVFMVCRRYIDGQVAKAVEQIPLEIQRQIGMDLTFAVRNAVETAVREQVRVSVEVGLRKESA